LREVNLTSKLAHPHIVPVFAAGEADELLYFVMPYIEGESLRQKMVRQGPLPFDEAISIAAEVAGALHYAHGFGVVHRDIKPENILLADDHAIVADFGIARALDVVGGENLTQAGIAVGTPAYMSPEQADGSANIDARTDVYSLGCVLFEMLGGRGHVQQGRQRRLDTMHDTLQTIAASTTTLAGLESLLRKAVAVDPVDRFVSCDAFARGLRDLQRPGPPVTPERRAVRLGAVLGALVISVALVAGLLLPSRGGAATPERVVVAQYENQTGDPALAHLGPMATDWITQGLAQTGLLNVVVARGGLADLTPTPTRPIARRIHSLVEETGAELVVSGAYYLQGGQLQFQTRITDPEGQVIIGLSPVITPLDSPLVAVELLRQRVMGALATLVDERLRTAARAFSQPPSYDAYQQYVEGMTQFVRINLPVAVGHFLRASELDSSFVTAKLLAAFVYTTMEDWRRADSLAQLVSRSRDALAPLERHQLDWVLGLARGDVTAALEAIRAASELTGDDMLIFEGLTALWANRPEEALEAVRGLDPERGFARDFILFSDWVCSALHALGRHHEELDEARLGRQQFPTARNTVLNELRALYALGEDGPVDSLWDLYVSLPTQSGLGESAGDAQRLAAMEARAHGRDALAEATFRRSVQWYRVLAPDEAALEGHRYGLARSLYMAGYYEESKVLLDSLARERPDSLGYRGYLGSLAARMGNRDEANAVLTSLADLEGPYTLGAASFWRARIASVLGDHEDAVRHLRRAEEEGFRFEGTERFTLDFQSMWSYPPFVEWIKPRG
jgi:tetratricopeptide (TPR) repeat protein